MARHRNPLFSRELGVTPSRSLVVELLHAVFRGVLLIWCRVAVWALIVGGVCGHSGGGGENIIAVVLVLRSRLMQFYPQQEKLNQEVLTRVADLTPSMLGSVNNPTLKTKGAEKWGLVLFLIAELRTHHARLPNAEGNRLLHAGQSIEQVVRAWKGSGWVMPLQQQKDSCLSQSLSHMALNVVVPYESLWPSLIPRVLLGPVNVLGTDSKGPQGLQGPV